MTECPACGRDVTAGEALCPQCGAHVAGITESFPPIEADLEESGEHVETAEGPLLVVRKGPELGERFYIDRPRLTLGRDPGSDVFLNDVTVSRNHAVVESGGGEIRIADAGSLNGTYVNGLLVDAARLESGDLVQIGRFQMLYISGGEPL
jgi:hypothetical protein